MADYLRKVQIVKDLLKRRRKQVKDGMEYISAGPAKLTLNHEIKNKRHLKAEIGFKSVFSPHGVQGSKESADIKILQKCNFTDFSKICSDFTDVVLFSSPLSQGGLQASKMH